MRTSHNPPAPELLDLADRMGFVVMVEAFDCWKRGKTRGRLQPALRRVAREGPAGHGPPRAESSQRGHLEHRQRDRRAERAGAGASSSATSSTPRTPTRPVTAGCNNASAGTNGFQTAVDAFGLNYNLWAYPRILDHRGNEQKPIYTSESSSCVSSRGEYFFPVKRGRDSQVELPGLARTTSTPRPGPSRPTRSSRRSTSTRRSSASSSGPASITWASRPRTTRDVTNLLNFSDPENRAEMKKQLDALGKLKVPSASSYFGIVDLCGFKKDRFYIYQARWRPDLPMAHILPHWNWPDRVGQVTPVHVYTSGDEAELFQDGKSLGRKKQGTFEYRLRWDDVVYQPGDDRGRRLPPGQGVGAGTR